jgi:hypothetical protein
MPPIPARTRCSEKKDSSSVPKTPRNGRRGKIAPKTIRRREMFQATAAALRKLRVSPVRDIIAPKDNLEGKQFKDGVERGGGRVVVRAAKACAKRPRKRKGGEGVSHG